MLQVLVSTHSKSVTIPAKNGDDIECIDRYTEACIDHEVNGLTQDSQQLHVKTHFSGEGEGGYVLL